jgi:hypothetical protein
MSAPCSPAPLRAEEDLSDEEADSAGPVKWVVPAWEVLANGRAGWRGGLKSLRVNECE